MPFSDISAKIDGYRDQVIELQKELVCRPALSPTYNAAPEHTGELCKVEYLEKHLKSIGITDLTRIDAKDARVPGGIRPSLIARVKGESSQRTVWIMAHTDVVPPGDMSKWTSDPYVLKVDGDLLVGRGVEDNHQGLVAGVMAARAFIECGIKPAYDLALLLVADEEAGSSHGIHYVLEQASPFHPQDLIIVPDGGNAEGSEIEVAEKSIMWCKFTVTGKQCHASTPHLGHNAMRAGAHLVVALERLREKFGDRDPVFVPAQSTFEPTKKDANVPAINILPGEDVFYLDCRVLPRYNLEDVEAVIRECIIEVEKKFSVKIELKFEQREQAAPATPVDAPIVSRMSSAIQEVYGVTGHAVGIGGGTVAAPLRRKGLHCVVWSRMDETMHGPNENARISNILGDAKVMAHVAATK
ncbi:MAG: M20 family metallo-hydrolase [Myxococcota bacterium]|nr:M20 family metallo-hydrolase [Myxococcota bacterium]